MEGSQFHLSFSQTPSSGICKKSNFQNTPLLQEIRLYVKKVQLCPHRKCRVSSLSAAALVHCDVVCWELNNNILLLVIVFSLQKFKNKRVLIWFTRLFSAIIQNLKKPIGFCWGNRDDANVWPGIQKISSLLYSTFSWYNITVLSDCYLCLWGNRLVD